MKTKQITLSSSQTCKKTNKTKETKPNKQNPKPSMGMDMASVRGLWQPLLDGSGPIASSGARRSSSQLLISQSLYSPVDLQGAITSFWVY